MGSCLRTRNKNFCRDNWVWGILWSCNNLRGLRSIHSALWLGNPQESPRRPRHRWDDSIKVDLMRDVRASTGLFCHDSLDLTRLG
jgi:hypothetical protein